MQQHRGMPRRLRRRIPLCWLVVSAAAKPYELQELMCLGNSDCDYQRSRYESAGGPFSTIASVYSST